ncbi:MAG: energy-coupling factor ABC transporter ATP-binding protein [Coriobacteriales bacterium]|jgi:energy-coupling factor transport system ATP-binding protein|nr:energy-coupling factor ABC transporter ATP-binding protein [Coriobacteriales bacterium]
MGISAGLSLEVRGYSFRYAGGDEEVLRDCCLELGYGELVALGGLSGSGKSTLLSALIGRIPHLLPGEQAGEIAIYVRGERLVITEMPIAERARYIGSVLQDADSQIVHAVVADEVAFGCENLGVEPLLIGQRVGDACEMMSLDGAAYTATLSGGQKQRLVAAATLAMDRRILVFDEPLANLDRRGAQLLLERLRALAQAGYAVLVIEHRLDVVAPFADRMLWLSDGRVGAYGEIGCAAGAARVVGERGAEEELAVAVGTAATAAAAAAAAAGVLSAPSVASEGTPCLALEGISYKAGARPILDGIDFTVNRAERLVILGENGCGKTTLLRIIARLQKPTSGRIAQFLDPALGERASAAWHKRVGYVYQNPSYQLFMPEVFAEVDYQSPNKEETQACLEMFGLGEFASRHSQALSEGQKRRLSIAAVVAQRPDVLLLDEPTVGQDHEHLQRMVDALDQLQRSRGLTLITVTHDIRAAIALGDRALWIQDGRVWREGTHPLIEEFFQTLPSVTQ